jgi:transcription elongation factor/antiterminator RfaH
MMYDELPKIETAAAAVRWYVVHTQPFAEDRAGVRLETQGYHIFCPRLRKMVRHARKSTIKFVPLFPGYLFLRLDISRERWRSVNGTRGVIRLLTQGDIPQAVPPGVVEDLKSNADVDGALDQTPLLHAGQYVRVTEGPFANFVGTLQRLNGTDRVHVLLNLLGRSVSATVRCEAISAVA